MKDIFILFSNVSAVNERKKEKGGGELSPK